MYWSHNERRRVDGPSLNPSGSGNSRRNLNIDEDIRRIISERAIEAFEDREDDVSGANEVQHYALIRETSNKCCRGEDRLTVSALFNNSKGEFQLRLVFLYR